TTSRSDLRLRRCDSSTRIISMGCQKLRCAPPLRAQDKILHYAANGNASFLAAWLLRRYFQKSPRRRLLPMQRNAKIFSAPNSDQNMPDCLHREPMMVLQPASTTPDPMKNPRLRKVPYCIRLMLFRK